MKKKVEKRREEKRREEKRRGEERREEKRRRSLYAAIIERLSVCVFFSHQYSISFIRYYQVH